MRGLHSVAIQEVLALKLVFCSLRRLHGLVGSWWTAQHSWWIGQRQEHRSGLECRTVNRLLPCVGSFTDG